MKDRTRDGCSSLLTCACAGAALVVACGREPAADRTGSPEACALLEQVDAEGSASEASSGSTLGPRRVTTNKITTNKITTNKITTNRITTNRLAGSAVAAGEDGALEELAATEDGRELLRYAVRCAFRPGQRLELGGDRVMSFEGSLGMAPAWAERALTEGEERWISACLLAHVNAFGVSVPISVRASGRIDADLVERQAFSVHEGAFFGSAAEGALYSCHAETPERARRESRDRGLRVCTDDDRCAVPSLGSCAEICDRYDEGIGFVDCRARGVVYAEVVNAYLRSDAVLDSCGSR